MTTSPTDRATRIAEIAERHEKATPGEWHWSEEMLLASPGEVILWPTNALSFEDADCSAQILGACGRDAEARADANKEFLAAAHQDIPYLLSALSTADAERREMAGLMREAAVLVHRVTRFGSPGIGFYCRLCEGREVDYHSDVQHGHHCLVTKLRQAADRAEGK